MQEIITLTDIEDFKKLAKIQESAWGFLPKDFEPHHLLSRIQKYGGLVQGLFLNRVLIGFSAAVLAKWRDEYFIYSHMVAVLQEFQGKGYGFLLKKAQREEILKMGYSVVRWNFDPLEMHNAYFNFHRLGVVSEEYERNIYGIGDSGLHSGIPTDRLIATWNLNHPGVKEKMEAKAPKIREEVDHQIINRFDSVIAYIEIPKDIRTLKKRNIDKARQWREKTRFLFESAFEAGYVVRDFVFSPDEKRCFLKLFQ